jgi:uncharacterized protein (TIGR02001 family)
MKKTLLAVTLAALTSGAATTALAADPKAPAPDFEISGNFGLFSDYRFRGISQTNTKPAVQGGFDLAHKSGVYVGTWASNVSQWANAGGSMEIDFYGGYATELPMGVGMDIGHIWYQYPDNTAGNKTREWYLGLSYDLLSYKFSRSTTNWFGIGQSKGSYYHSLGLEIAPVEKVTLGAAAGYQKVKGSAEGENSFKDYSVSASYDLGNDFSIAVSYHWISFKDNAARDTGWFSNSTTSGAANDIGKSGAVISLSKTF